MSGRVEGISIIESVLGVDRSMGQAGLRCAFEDLMHCPMTDDQFYDAHYALSEIARLGGSPLPISLEVQEATTVLDSLKDVFQRDRAQHANTLVDWPSYQSMMEEHGQRIGGTALLIGSISPLSSRAFGILARDVYGADSSMVIDIETTLAKSSEGCLVLGSGTELPFQTGSISYVHTNRLTHMLKEPGKTPRTKWSGILELFREIHRVLVPGGQVFMQEILPDRVCTEETLARFTKILSGGATQAGLDNVITRNSISPIGMDYLSDESRDFGRYVQVEITGVIDLFARKDAA